MKIAFLGDIALIGKYDLTKNHKAKERLKELSEKLSEYDYVVGNLESPLTNQEKTMVCKSMHLRSSSVNVELLKYLHIDAVSLANNHLYDFGSKGLEETIKTLDENGIDWFGANSRHIVKEIRGEKISLSGYCCYSTNGTGYIRRKKSVGINPLTIDNVMSQIDKDIDDKAFSVMSFHWGDEHTNYPKYEHIQLAKQIADKKNVLICGHHPHIIQGVQRINNSIVAYSLGNFLFDDCTSITGSFVLKQNSNNKKSFIFEVEIENNDVVSEKYHGFKDKEDGFVFFDIENELHQISQPLNEIDALDKYEEKRKLQISKVMEEKFGNRNFKWLMSRLNYYSLGAYITAKLRRKRYLKEAEYFLDGSKL